MTAIQHNKILAVGNAVFAAIIALPILLMMIVGLIAFIGLGVSSAAESGRNSDALYGIFGGVFAVVFYGLIGAFWIVPLATASWKMFKGRRSARVWGIIAGVTIVLLVPLGTALAIYAFWFLFSEEGKRFYAAPILSNGSVR